MKLFLAFAQAPAALVHVATHLAGHLAQADPEEAVQLFDTASAGDELDGTADVQRLMGAVGQALGVAGADVPQLFEAVLGTPRA